MHSSEHAIIHVDWMMCRIEGAAPGLEIDKACSFRNKPLAMWLRHTTDLYGDPAIEWFYGLPRGMQERVRRTIEMVHRTEAGHKQRTFLEHLRAQHRKWTDTGASMYLGEVNSVDPEKTKERATKLKNSIASAVHLYDAVNQTFPYGLLELVEDTLETYGFSYEVREPETKPSKDEELEGIQMISDLWEHQSEALEAVSKNRQGILEIATGGGKTRVMSGILAAHQCRSLVLVTSKELLHQTASFLGEDLRDKNGNRVPIGKLGDGCNSVCPITVATIQSAYKRAEQLGAYGFQQVLADEGHHAASKTYFAVLRKVAPYYCYCLTGTGFRNTRSEDIALKASFTKTIYKITTEELQEKGVLSELRLEVLENPTEYDKTYQWFDLHDKAIVNCPKRNMLLARRMKELAEDGNTMLVMVDQVEQGQRIATALRMCGFRKFHEVYGDPSLTPKHVRENALDDIRKREVPIIIGTVYNEGIDIPTLDVVVNAAGKKPKIKIFQRVGRAVRKGEGKSYGLVLDVWDDGHRLLKEHSRQRLLALKEAGVPIPEHLQERLEEKEIEVDLQLGELTEEQLRDAREMVEANKKAKATQRSLQRTSDSSE